LIVKFDQYGDSILGKQKLASTLAYHMMKMQTLFQHNVYLFLIRNIFTKNIVAIDLGSLLKIEKIYRKL